MTKTDAIFEINTIVDNWYLNRSTFVKEIEDPEHDAEAIRAVQEVMDKIKESEPKLLSYEEQELRKFYKQAMIKQEWEG